MKIVGIVFFSIFFFFLSHGLSFYVGSTRQLFSKLCCLFVWRFVSTFNSFIIYSANVHLYQLFVGMNKIDSGRIFSKSACNK